MKSIPLASHYEPRVYPVYAHQRPTLPFITLEPQRRDWYCCTCQREGRWMLIYHTGLISCADPTCRSRFVIPLDDKDDDAEYRKKLTILAKTIL